MKHNVLIIGAGPTGTAAGARLVQLGHSVLCLERQYFPRHVIGESLLPRCNELLEELGMLDAVKARHYMVKHGAVFVRGDEYERFDFSDALPGDYPTTFQVPRGDFDQTLATEARRMGVDLRFGHQVDQVDFQSDHAVVTIRNLDANHVYQAKPSFVLDCSGYGRVLPRLLNLERPALLPQRVSCFSTIENDVRLEGDKAGDIWICVHPDNGWIWMIPFSDGRTSIGCVCDVAHWEALTGSNTDKLFAYLNQEPNAQCRLRNAARVAPTRLIQGYSKKVERLYGKGWALAGNASDFLDPVFSSGVTLALETGLLAANLIDRELQQETVDWSNEYEAPINQAVGVFLSFIESWYSGELQTIFFAKQKAPKTKSRITSILGGHVLRTDNTFVDATEEALHLVHRHIIESIRA